MVSPDGRYVVFSAQDSSGDRLWLRPLDALEARPLPGTEDALEPFWSADSRQIGFESTASEELWRVDLNGGSPQLVTESSGGGEGRSTWNRAGDILVPVALGSIHRVFAVEGTRTAEPLTSLDASRQEIWHSDPQFLPGGERFLFFVMSREADYTGTYAASLAAPDSRTLIAAGSKASYAAPGFFLFTLGGTLLARRFDVGKLEAAGEPTPVVDRVAVADGAGLYSASSNGVLSFRRPFASQARLTWFDRGGKSLGELPLPEGAQSPELSPQGERLAFERIDPETGYRDVWIWEFDREVATKVTTDPSDDSDPVWASDGRSIIFSSARRGYPSLHRTEVGSSGAAELIREAEDADWPLSWSSDGEHVILARWAPRSGPEAKLLLLALSGGGAPTRLLDTDSQELSGQFSPDGEWIAYVTNRTGREEVYIEPFPRTGSLTQVSTQGGSQPRWKGDGEEIYYLDPGGMLMAVKLSSEGATLRPSTPQELFQTRVIGPGGVGVRFAYDVSADGQRFLIHSASKEARPSPIIVVTDWTKRLEH